MDYNEINKLLEKYWNAETSPAEEKKLRALLSKPNLPPEYKETADMFRFFNSEKKGNALGKDFDEKLLNKLSQDKATTKVIPAWRRYSVAASVAILVTVGAAFYFQNQDFDLEGQPKMSMTNAYAEDTFDDPQEAFEHTKKTLLMLSARLEKGSSQISKIEKLNDAQSKIKEQ